MSSLQHGKTFGDSEHTFQTNCLVAQGQADSWRCTSGCGPSYLAFQATVGRHSVHSSHLHPCIHPIHVHSVLCIFLWKELKWKEMEATERFWFLGMGLLARLASLPSRLAFRPFQAFSRHQILPRLAGSSAGERDRRISTSKQSRKSSAEGQSLTEVLKLRGT